jgi:hypothetical protein
MELHPPQTVGLGPLAPACPARTRSSGQTRALTVTQGTKAMTVTCISAGTGATRLEARHAEIKRQVREGTGGA